jgi:hypothetical protein
MMSYSAPRGTHVSIPLHHIRALAGQPGFPAVETFLLEIEKIFKLCGLQSSSYSVRQRLWYIPSSPPSLRMSAYP